MYENVQICALKIREDGDGCQLITFFPTSMSEKVSAFITYLNIFGLEMMMKYKKRKTRKTKIHFFFKRFFDRNQVHRDR